MSERSLKPGWQVWRFDQMATSVNDRINDPSKADVEYYVGLEHLDSDSLKIRRWGTPSDVEATKLCFRKGDIIFGRRRVYQRKVAVADFDGICSAHALVLRPKPAVVDPGFLPFFMQSDLFMERAKAISVGSLSPTINWKTLAKEEFALPPLEEQRRIVQVCITSNEHNEQLKIAAIKALNVEVAWLKNIVERYKTSGCSQVPLGKLLEKPPESGVSAPPQATETGHWVLALNALSEMGYVPEQIKPVEPSEAMLSAVLRQGDLLISRSNTVDRVGFVGIYNGENEGFVSFPDTMMRLCPNTDIVSHGYLQLYLQSSIARRQIVRIAAGTSASMKKINKTNLHNISVVVPNRDEQQRVVVERKQIAFGRLAIIERIKQSHQQHFMLLKRVISANYK